MSCANGGGDEGQGTEYQRSQHLRSSGWTSDQALFALRTSIRTFIPQSFPEYPIRIRYSIIVRLNSRNIVSYGIGVGAHAAVLRGSEM